MTIKSTLTEIKTTMIKIKNTLKNTISIQWISMGNYSVAQALVVLSTKILAYWLRKETSKIL